MTRPQTKRSICTTAKPSKGRRTVFARSATGVVNYYVRGRMGRPSAVKLTPAKLVNQLRVGLRVGELDALQAALDVPMARLADLLGISKATLHRRKSGQRLDPAESDRVVRFARLLGRAAEVFESLENARRWLTSPQVGLGGETPLDFAQTEVGAREVEDLLGRIEYGIYS